MSTLYYLSLFMVDQPPRAKEGEFAENFKVESCVHRECYYERMLIRNAR
jgi:hypothetical protein